MPLFSKKKDLNINFDDIVFVVILEETQLYEGKPKMGVSFGTKVGDGRLIALNEQVPVGAEIAFSVTYKDGRKEVVRAMSGTDQCTRLLQLAMDPPSNETDASEGDAEEYTPFTLQKNQLPIGDYIIGEIIPAGTYDFTWVFGSGSLHLNKGYDETGALGSTKFFQWVGNTKEYEFRQCLNLNCEQGDVLALKGNVVVEISPSRKVQIEL